MFSRFKLNIVATSILVCSFGSAAKAQLASDKSLNEIYNKKINEKLEEKNKSKDLSKPLQKDQNLPSSKSSLKDIAKLKIKNPEIVAHSNLVQSDEENKNKLLSNSTKLKQMGTTATKSQKAILH
jgi:hypothetical protein